MFHRVTGRSRDVLEGLMADSGCLKGFKGTYIGSEGRFRGSLVPEDPDTPDTTLKLPGMNLQLLESFLKSP